VSYWKKRRGNAVTNGCSPSKYTTVPQNEGRENNAAGSEGGGRGDAGGGGAGRELMSLHTIELTGLGVHDTSAVVAEASAIVASLTERTTAVEVGLGMAIVSDRPTLGGGGDGGAIVPGDEADDVSASAVTKTAAAVVGLADENSLLNKTSGDEYNHVTDLTAAVNKDMPFERVVLVADYLAETGEMSAENESSCVAIGLNDSVVINCIHGEAVAAAEGGVVVAETDEERLTFPVAYGR